VPAGAPPGTPTKGTLIGNYNNHVDILGIQYSQTF